MIRLITCNTIQEAYIIKGHLNNENIECLLTNQNFTSLLPIYNNMLGAGIQILVKENDYEIAKGLVIDKTQPENIEKKCPNCGSQNLSLGLGKNKFLKILNVVLALLASIPLVI